jgi:hypothetical protein
MKQFAMLLLVLMTSWFAKADLLERMKLEDTLKNRIEDAFRLYDPKARALIRFDYKTFTGTLPGTSIETRGEVNNFNIDSGDINRVSIEIFTDLEDVTPEAKDYVLKAIPIEKSKVSVEYKKLKAQFPKEVAKPNLDPQALSTIAQDTVNSMTKLLGTLFGATLLVLIAFVFHQNSKKLKEFKLQIQLLTAAFGERASAPMPAAMPQGAGAMAGANYSGAHSSGKENHSLKKLGLSSLKELFADAYWCRDDAYASWLWKNIESEQKSELLAQLSFMKSYSLFFVDIGPRELSYHEHPYYLDPMGLLWISQEDLSAQVRLNYSHWHFLSPMRQQNLPLTLEERLTAVQTKPDTRKPNFESRPPSELRVLEAKLSWGELSSEDESALFNHPEMVPAAMRNNIHSLVWLAQKDDTFIQKALAKYDARTLAAAWVGPDGVLKKLEAQLPEKKLKLLLNYKEKMIPSRHTEAYMSLVAEGFKNEAA